MSAPAVAFAIIHKLSQMLRRVKHAGPDAKEPDTPGFTGAKEGDASDA